MRKASLSLFLLVMLLPASAYGHAIHSTELAELNLPQETSSPAKTRVASSCYDLSTFPAGAPGTIDTVVVNPAGVEVRNLGLAEVAKRAAVKASGYVAAASSSRKTFRFSLACPGEIDVKALNIPLSVPELQAMSGPQAAYGIASEINKVYGRQSNLRLVVVNGFQPEGAAGYGLIGYDQAMVFIAPDSALSTLDFTYTAAHELMHVMGAVNPRAPHGSPGMHCFEGNDLMCYDDGTLPQPMIKNCSQSRAALPALDCGNDDYFSPSPAAGSFLAENPKANAYNSPYLMSCSESPEMCLRGQRPIISDAKAYNVDAISASASAWVTSLNRDPVEVSFVVTSGSRSQVLPVSSGSDFFERELSLKPGQTYHLQVLARNRFGLTESAPVEFTSPVKRLRISRVKVKKAKNRTTVSFYASASGEVVLRAGGKERSRRVKFGWNQAVVKAFKGRVAFGPAAGYELRGAASFPVR